MFEHTRNHIDCPACEARRARILEPAVFGRLRFRDAAPIWLRDRGDSISDKTREQYELYIRTLGEFFAGLPLEDIHIGHVDEYVDSRQKKDRVGSSSIRHEVNALKQIMERAGLWGEIAKFYRPPKLQKSKAGKAIDPADEERLLVVAASNKRWRVAYWGWLIARTTTVGPSELAHVHLNDVDLNKRTLRIRDGLKNGYRERVITLNDAAFRIMGDILKRYYRILRKAHLEPDPEHFILPGRKRNCSYNPWIPMGSTAKAWRSLRVKAELPNLRQYDGRHLAITAMLESPEVSERTVTELAGHVSKRMLDEYSHIRLGPKRAATDKLMVNLPGSVETSVDGAAEISLIPDKNKP